MDKVKIYLALLLKYHFWVLSGLVLIIAFSGWGIATAALANYYKTQRAKIDAEFAKMQAITRKDNHPNKTFEEGVDKLLNKPDGLKASVLKAWDVVYDEQKNQVLKWPEELGEDFLQHVQDKGPENEIAVKFRERYQNYIKAEFPRLVTIVKAEPHAGALVEVPAAGDAAAEAKKKEDFIVNWRADNQHEIDDALDWPRPPTTKELLYVQENLWVYHALLDIIAQVNETATGHYNAKIKDINVMAIARHAAQEFQAATAPGKIYLPAAAQGTSPAPPGQPSGGPLGGKGSASNAALAAVQDEGRYVDAKGQPLAAGAAAPPEFKRMPIYLQLMMDQREISLLLAECANSPLPVEVHQVRINPASLRKENKTVSPSVFGGAKRGGGGGASAASSGGPDQDLNPYDMPVEVFGIIYIYNPPNRAKLDVIGQAAGAAEPSAAGEPAAGPPGEEKPAMNEPAGEKPAEPKEPVPVPADADKPAAVIPEPAAAAAPKPAVPAAAPAAAPADEPAAAAPK
jgi:hypothetical protein